MILDVSSQKKVREAKSWPKEVNQLYHPTGIFKTESFELVYSGDNLNTTKFTPILLKEWFYLVKKNGYLVIDYQPNKLCDSKKLEEIMIWLWKGTFKIKYHWFISKDNKKNLSKDKINLNIKLNKKNESFRNGLRFICQKTKSLKIPNDGIIKWTFGIITNGKRGDWVQQIIKSVRQQKIPHFEIIICGTYTGKVGKDIIYIPFNKRDDKGWITKKKNLIVQKARYENICMLHDRMVLDKNWYKGIKKWGNCFENLGCVQTYNGSRVNDWIASHFFVENRERDKFSFESYVNYPDWYESVWFLGQLNIFKKYIVVKNNLWWNENLYYGQREDYDFSKRLNKSGFIHRFNNLSKVETLTHKYLNPTYIKFNSQSLNPQMKLNNFNSYMKLVTFLFLKTLSLFHIYLRFKTLENIRGRIYTLLLKLKPKRFFYNQEWKKALK